MRCSARSALGACLLLAAACGEKTAGDGSGTGASDGGGTQTSGSGGGGGPGSGGGTAGSGTTGGGTGGTEFDPAVLTQDRGCGDVTLYATDADDTWLLLFATTDAPAEAAHAEGATQELSYTLPDAAVTVELQWGTKLAGGVCNDTPPEGSVDAVYTATQGSADLTVVPMGMPEPWEVPANASLVLSDLVLEDPSGETITIDGYEFVDVFVGWFPG